MRDIQKLIPAEAIVYGRLPLMITENCLVQNETGCHLSEAGDAVPQQAPCRKPNDLQDRTGAKFPLLPAYGHRTEIQNSTPVWLADKPEWKHCGLTYARLRFTTEAPAECADIFRAYQTGAPASGPFTRGLYYLSLIHILTFLSNRRSRRNRNRSAPQLVRCKAAIPIRF